MAARLDALLLCDFAQIREGLLFVNSGGLTRLVMTSLPGRTGCHLAAMVQVPPNETGAAHRMVMKIKSVEQATLIATIDVAVHESAHPPGLAPGEARQVPIVVPLNQVVFPGVGQYDLQVDLDDTLAGDLSFRVELRPTRSPESPPS